MPFNAQSISTFQRLNRRAARKERKRERAAREEAARLKAGNSVDFETFEDDAAFHELEAAGNKATADKLSK